MRTLPIKAQAYLYFIYFAGALCLLSFSLIHLPVAPPSWQELMIFFVLAAIGSGKKI